MILTDDQFVRIYRLISRNIAYGGDTVKRNVEAIINEPAATSDEQVPGYSITQGADRRWYGHEVGERGIPLSLLPVRRSMDRDDVVAACQEHDRERPERERVRQARDEARKARKQATERDDFDD